MKSYLRKSHRWLPLIFLIFALSPLRGAEETTLLRPYKAQTPPVLDGILDDAVWQKAPSETGFKTYHPDYDKNMADDTIVYYAYDSENIYFAFRCLDSDPDKIKASVNSRDNIRPDDWICINLDTFNDQQTLHVFYVNPRGIQGDSRFEGNAEDFSVDLVWYSSGRIDEQGYAIEMRIPFKSIRHTGKKVQTMGVIFERMINRHSQAGTFPPLSPEHGPNFLTQTRPILFEDVKKYSLVEILPAATYSRQSFHQAGSLSSEEGQADLSLTAKYGITPDLIFDGTYNPDFSQVEADAGQVDFNLRYSLFFSEKRPFFLEGLERFNFGGAAPSDPLREVVHTRTIADPLVGFKLNGRVGKKNTIASIYAMDRLPEGSAGDYAHFSIFRLKRALSHDGFLGGFYTGRDRQGGFNRLFGLDGQIRLNPSSYAAFHGFLSQTKESGTARLDGYALGFHYDYATRNWNIAAGFQDLSKDFRTETGYLTRNGLTRFRLAVVPLFYPKSGLIKRIMPLFQSQQTRDKYSGLYETLNAFDMRFLLGRNSIILFGARYSNEVFLNERFNTSGARFLAQSQLSKKLTLNLFYNRGDKVRYTADPYQGKGNDASLGVEYQPWEKLHLELSLIYSDFTRSADNFKAYDYTILRNRNTYQVNKYLFFRGIVEYNSFYKTLMTDFLASFTYIPGTVIHIGYGSLYERMQWMEGEYRPADNYLETRRGFFFKASYLWRL
jgi:hypothetical protein